MKTYKNCIFMLLALGVCFLPGFSQSTAAAEVRVGTFTELRAAITAATEPTVITVEDEIAFPGTITIAAGKDITLRSAVFTKTGSGRHFTVAANAALTLEDVILDGGNSDAAYAITRGGVTVAARGTLTLGAGTVVTHCAAGSGGGVYNNGTLLVSGGRITQNFLAVTYSEANIYYYGAGIYNNGGMVGMMEGSIDANGGDYDEAAVATFGGGIYSRGGTVQIDGGTIQGNYAAYGGGIQAEDAVVSVVASEISDNIGGTAGGGLYLTGGALTLTDSTVSGNSGGESPAAAAMAGGIFVYGGAHTITNSHIRNNTTSGSGGGIYISGGSVNMVNSTVRANRAGRSGGGIETGILTRLTAQGTAFSDNSAAAAYWMTDAADIATHTARISDTTVFSAPPAGHLPFEYAYNNYDIGYTKGLTANLSPIFSADFEGGVSARVNNSTEAEISGFVIAVVYDKASNGLAAMMWQPFVAPADADYETVFDLDLDGYPLEDYTYAVFFWDADYMPLTEAITSSSS